MTSEQEKALEDLRRDYGVTECVAGVVIATDGDGDRWWIKENGERECLGSGILVPIDHFSEPRDEEA